MTEIRSVIRPTQSIMYVPLQVDTFQKSILLIVQYKYLKSCYEDCSVQNPILLTRSCGTGFITQSSWVFHFHQTTLVWWKCFVPQLCQFRRGISEGPALKYFNRIDRGGQYIRNAHRWRCNSKEAWKRLTRRQSRNGLWNEWKTHTHVVK